MAARKTWTPLEVEQFTKLCSIFCTKKEICSIMNIPDHRTLDKRISESFPDTPTWNEAFDYFSGQGKASIRRKQFELAMQGDKTMLIFLGKNYLGQSDNGAKQDETIGSKAAKITAFTSSSKFAKAANG